MLKDVKGVSELFNWHRIFYKQESNLSLASDFISERIRNSESVIAVAQNEGGGYWGFTQLYPTFFSVSAQPCWVLYDWYLAENARGLGVDKN